MKRAPIILCCIFVVCSAGGITVWADRTSRAAEQARFESYYHRDGKKEALADIARGTPKWKVHGLWDDSAITSLNVGLRTIGLEADWFQGCISSNAINRYAEDYDAAIRAHVIAIYGEDAVKAVLGEKERRESPDREEQVN